MEKIIKFFGGKKILMWLTGILLAALKSQWPDLPLPSEEFLTDTLMALFAAHTLTDVSHIGSTVWKEVLAGRAKATVGQPAV